MSIYSMEEYTRDQARLREARLSLTRRCGRLTPPRTGRLLFDAMRCRLVGTPSHCAAVRRRRRREGHRRRRGPPRRGPVSRAPELDRGRPRDHPGAAAERPRAVPADRRRRSASPRRPCAPATAASATQSILQVTGVTNPLGLGFESQAMVGIRTTGPPELVADELAHWEEADYVVVTTGRFDLLVEVVCADRRALLDVTNRIRVAARAWSRPRRSSTSSSGSSCTTGAQAPTDRRSDDEPRERERARRRDVRLEEVVKEFGDDARRRRHLARDPARRVLRAARAVRVREDDDPAHDRRLRGADVRPHLPRRPRRRGAAAVQAGRQHRLPELRALPAHDGRRERRVRARAEEARQDRDHARASPRSSSSSTSPGGRAASRASSRAASSNASRSPARSSTTRGCSCSTSRSGRSTSSSASRCSSS